MGKYSCVRFDIARKSETVKATDAQQISSKPCFLFAVFITGSAAGTERISVHDGHSANAEALLNMCSTNKVDSHQAFDPPMYFSQGMYLAVATNIQGATFHFITEDNCY